MTDVQLQVGVPKSLNDALTALEAVVSDLKAGKGVLEVVASHFQDFAMAVTELNQLGPDMTAEPFESVQCGAVHGVKVVRLLLGK